MMLLAELIALFGALFMLLAGIGTVRFPDLLNRMHAATKSSVFGGILIMCAVVIAVPTSGVFLRAIAIILFICFTTPVAAHILSRAGYLSGIDLSPDTIKDDLAGKYVVRSDKNTDAHPKTTPDNSHNS